MTRWAMKHDPRQPLRSPTTPPYPFHHRPVTQPISEILHPEKSGGSNDPNSMNVQLQRLQRDTWAGSIPRGIVEFPGKLGGRSSGTLRKRQTAGDKLSLSYQTSSFSVISSAFRRCFAVGLCSLIRMHFTGSPVVGRGEGRGDPWLLF